MTDIGWLAAGLRYRIAMEQAAMTDIVERLRRPFGTRPSILCKEAADEIDRLRAALQLSQSQNYCTLCGRALEPKP